jgi:DNA-binding transcriptional MerR regulator
MARGQRARAAEDRHVSIGDVLDRLRDEFPDVTVSKIRFLESQGLIDPERTPSGYRKFYDADIARLRWVLRQQKEHFLPLKVIKERLDEIDRQGGLGGVHDGDGGDGGDHGSRTGGRSVVPMALEMSGMSLTRGELAQAAGLTDDELADLEAFGVLRPSVTGRDRVLFDEDALDVAKVARDFLRLGVEARHLRMYRAFAEREADLFGQLLLPYRNRRNPEATAEAARRAAELAELGRRLRTALLRQSLRSAGRR